MILVLVKNGVANERGIVILEDLFGSFSFLSIYIWFYGLLYKLVEFVILEGVVYFGNFYKFRVGVFIRVLGCFVCSNKGGKLF